MFIMTKSATEGRPLPGSMGLPLLGETLAFAKNPWNFFDVRTAKHGPAFKTNILGRKTAVITTPDALDVFIDPDKCIRANAMPNQLFEIFGGESLPTMDGAAHLTRKKTILAGFNKAALVSYLPGLQAAIERSLARCAQLGEFGWLDELKSLAFQGICENVMGLDSHEQIDSLVSDYGAITKGFAALPIKLPFTTFGKSMKARNRALDTLRAVVKAHAEGDYDDGLARILAYEPKDGTDISVEETVRELHHIVIAGYIVFGAFAATAMWLKQSPDVLAELRAEIEASAPSGPLSLQTLHSMSVLRRVVMEVKRMTPIVPSIFAIAKKSFPFKGYTIPEGWMVIWSLRGTHRDPSVYADPDTFDPDRFSSERAEDKRHEHAFVPQGAGPLTGHKCAGLEYSTMFMELFALLLARDYDWDLPPQELAYNSAIPAEPADGLRASLSRRTG
jgi:cytochrome P450